MKMFANLTLIASAVIGLSVVVSTAQAKTQAPGTVVVRVNPETGAAEKLLLTEELGSKDQAASVAANGNFQALDTSKIAVSELDREAGASSWYWYCNYCYSNSSYSYTQTSYYYYGYTYQPYYYTYSYGYYYYYYSSSRTVGQAGWWR